MPADRRASLKHLRGACAVAGRYQYLSSDRAETLSLYVKTHFMSFLFVDFFFLKFGIVFEKNSFFRVIFKLSYQTNILINFLVSSMYTKRNYWGIKSIEYIFFYFWFSTPVYFLSKKCLCENSKIYSTEVLASGLLFLMRLRLYKSVGK